MVRAPSVLQSEAAECGAASLAMVLAFHGRWVPLEELRVLCGVSRDGSKASNLLRAARSFGVTAKGFRKEPAELLDLPLPSILFVNFSHYVVLEGMRDGRVFLNDPASGRRSMPAAEFGEIFTGVVLTFEPGPGFEKGGIKPSIVRDLAGYMRDARAGLAYAGIASVLLVLPGFAIPAFAKIFVDDVLVARLTGWILPLSFGVLGATAIRLLLTAWQQRALLRLETRLALAMSTDYLQRLLRLPLAFFAQRSAGELAGRVQAGERLARLVAGEFATAIFNAIAIVFYAAVMFAYSVSLALVVIALSAVNVAVLVALRERRGDLGRLVTRESGRLGGETIALIRDIENIKVAGAGDDSFERWAGWQAGLLDAYRDLGSLSARLSAIPPIVSVFTSAAVLGIGGFQVIDGHLTIGGLVAVQALAALFSGPLSSIASFAGRAQIVGAEAARIADAMRYALPSAPASAPARAPERGLALRDVTFGYSPLATPLVSGFSLEIAAGSRIALVGRSGSGKSTIARIAAGLLPPWSGTVHIDGALGYVDQDVMLFAGTVRENLTLFDETIADEELLRALADAELLTEIVARGGLDTPVDEAGRNFSGGQRQRLEIARILVGDPPYVVIDEATSALDPEVEARIITNLQRRGCACLAVAHRLSSVRASDEVIVIDGGRIVERGAPDALLERDGAFAALVRSA